MKTALIIIITFFLFMVCLVLIEPYKWYTARYQDFCIDVELINGKHKHITVNAPTTSHFQINTDRGSYYLQYVIGPMTHWRTVQNGVIDFEIVKCN